MENYARLITDVVKNEGIVGKENLFINMLKGGCINALYTIKTQSTKYVMKIYIDTKMGNIYERYQREKTALEIVRSDTRIPAPKILHDDCSCTKIPFPFILMEYKKGELLGDKLRSADRTRYFSSLNESLRILKRIHTVVSTEDMLPLEYGNFSTRFQQLHSYLFAMLDSQHVKKNLNLWSEVENVNKAFLDWNNLSIGGRLSFIHGDFRFDNLLVDSKKKIVGVVDWELSQNMDPWMDLGTFFRNYLLSRLPKSKEHIECFFNEYSCGHVDILILTFFMACREIFEVGYLMKNNVTAAMKCLQRARILLDIKRECSLYNLLKIYS